MPNPYLRGALGCPNARPFLSSTFLSSTLLSMHSMSWIAPTASFLEILLLLYVATIDIATRLIRNEICLVLAILGIAGQLASPMQVAESLIAATILLLLLVFQPSIDLAHERARRFTTRKDIPVAGHRGPHAGLEFALLVAST